MPEVVAIEWVIAIVIGGLLLGLAAGWWGVSRIGGGKAKVAELQQALDNANEEMADYKREVFGEFAETAEKFRALDKSYNDLHRQLAKSSVALCGDSATPLLAGPGPEEALEEKEIEAASGDAEADAGAAPTVAEPDTADRLAGDETADDPDREIVADGETAPAEEIVVAEAANDGEADAPAESADTETPNVAAVDEIPTLTDTDTDEPRRESA